MEIIVFDELIKVDRKHFKSDAKMPPKQEMLFHFNHIFIIIWVVLPHMVQNSNLNNSLPVKPLFVPYNFKSYIFFSHMVKGFYNLTKTSFS